VETGFSQYPARGKENRSSGDSFYSPDDLAQLKDAGALIH